MSEQFLARDVYPTWKRRLKGATEFAWVLTPYLDHSLVRLLENAPIGVTRVVVTDLSPGVGPANYRKKLLALRTLIERRVDVRVLSRLHAKVLVVDGEELVAGSQNFTSYARSSKEVSSLSDRKPDGAFAIISKWVADSEPVDLELIDRLIESTDEPSKAVDEAILQLDEQVLSTIVEVQEEIAERARQAAASARREAEEKQKFSLAAEVLKKRVVQTQWQPSAGPLRLIPDSVSDASWTWDDYLTMYGTNSRGERSGVDLTRWCRDEKDGLQPLKLRHLHFYPMIHLPAGRMVFARIGKSRITYVKHGVKFRSACTVACTSRYLSLIFPKALIDGANLVVKVRPWATSNAQHEIGIQFDGENHEMRWERAVMGFEGSLSESASKLVLEELGDPVRGADLLQQLLEPIRISPLSRDDKNAAAFFDQCKHEVKLIEYGTSKILVAVKL